ncbi:SLC13 family permease [Brooklawnia cerclae]|uniref:H+/gluconate symporter-like permease n=1 Tax=Brooklawnia cerclae TaxID=349934 RepID=A0ABX0SII7_9ACTN|nr:SLC13 family permease [Brooklawnia cerclae]NIH57719.1 H+/gluconate symporter-like permease [Brooklawnia cerclae]
MSATWLIIDFVLVFIGIALLIVRLKLNPALALLIGTIVLGLTTGVPMSDVVDGVNQGFGDLMAEVGLLISLGIIMGLLMSSYGAVQRIVEGILKLFGKKGSPFAFSLTLSTITPAIYFDVLLVLVAPIARRVAKSTGRPVASLAGPVSMGLAAGNALVIPGAAMLAYLGTIGMSAGDMLIPGFAVAIPTVALTTFLYIFAMEKLRWWKAPLDEDIPADDSEASVETPAEDVQLPSMGAALAPVLVVLVLIIAAIVAPLAGADLAFVEFLGSPVIALLMGVLTALVITVRRSGLRGQEEVVGKALETAGTILVVTAVAGSLGQIIASTGMKDVLAGLFEANAALPLVAVWFIAAVLRMAIGGQTVSGITAISIISPLVGTLGLPPALVVLAAGAGGCFGGQFSDNAFWMVRSLFGLTTRGTLKTYTLSQSMLSVVVLAVVLIVDIFV